MAPRTFAVVGAGVAGLQAAAHLLHHGYEVTVLESSSNVGGVWKSNYAGYRLQVQKWHYVIPGYEWPDTVSDPKYPTGAEVQAYIEAYAKDSGVLPHILFNTTVTGVAPKGGAEASGRHGWELGLRDASGNDTTKQFDFVVIATGLFSAPNRPAWADALGAAGAGAAPQVVDARDFTDAAAAKGKHVVIVGAGKTAVDLAVAVHDVAASTAFVARRSHWMAPAVVLGFIPFEWASYTRWAWALQPAWYAAGAVNKAAHALFYPLVTAVWALFGLLFPLHTGTPAPKFPLLEGIYDTIGIVNQRVTAKAFHSGRIQVHRASVTTVGDGKVELSDGSTVPADIVILATGYKTTHGDLFSPALRAKAGFEGGDSEANQWLYRNVLPPHLSNLAFIGLNATFQHVLTTALQSRWLVGYLEGSVAVPPSADQLKDIQQQQAWLKSFGGVRRNNNHVWAQHGKVHDQFYRDITGKEPALRGWNLVYEWFAYVHNQLFAHLFPVNQALRNSLLLQGSGNKVAAASSNGALANGGAGGIAHNAAKVVTH